MASHIKLRHAIVPLAKRMSDFAGARPLRRIVLGLIDGMAAR